MEEMITDEEKLISLLKKLNEVQAQLSATRSTLFERHTMDEIKSVIEMSKSTVDRDSKKYGQNPDEASQSIEELSESLEEARNEYSNEKNFWLMETSQQEKDEFKRIIEIRELQIRKKQIEADLASIGDEPKRKEELEKQINECESRIKSNMDAIQALRLSENVINGNIDDCASRCNSTITEASEEKGLIPIEETDNVFFQFIGRIRNKIGGKNKFKLNVIEPLKKKSTYIKDVVIYRARDEIRTGMLPKVKEIYPNNSVDVNLTSKIAEQMKTVKDGAPVIVETGCSSKNHIVSSFSKAYAPNVHDEKKIGSEIAELQEQKNVNDENIVDGNKESGEVIQ